MPGRFIPESREDMSGAAELLEPSSDPPRGIVFHVDFVMKLRLVAVGCMAASVLTPPHDRSCVTMQK